MTETTVECIVEQFKALLYEKHNAEKTNNFAKIPEIKERIDEFKKKKIVIE